MEQVKVSFSNGLEVEVGKGTNLGEVMSSAGQKKDFPCGGLGKCGKCETEILVAGTGEKARVLACSFPVMENIQVLESTAEETGAVILTGDSPGTPEKHQKSRGLSSAPLGLAIDIGTTTVVVYLVDLETGEELETGADLNGQRIFGGDVISRINLASQGREQLEKLQKTVLATIKGIITRITKNTGVSPEQIKFVTVAGNTCMHHLFLGLDPRGLGRAPFQPVRTEPVQIKAAQLGLELHPEAVVWVFPVIAGFVGGDTVAAILATRLHESRGNCLLIDIGTNSEMVVKGQGRMSATSAAAGPALEGAQISCGMRAVEGAISKVSLAPQVEYEVIANSNPRGICGSGIIDVLAEMIKAGLVTNRGRLADPQSFQGPEYLRSRLAGSGHEAKFILVLAEENDGKEIHLSQKDISQIQLAKGAIRAAQELLIESVGISADSIEQVFVAGAFGNFMNVENGMTIGLLPEWARGKLTGVGNAAGKGAKLALLSEEQRLKAASVRTQVEFLELGGTEGFQKAFTKGMLFSTQSR
ncbi:MAG TPA: ASKHA domain-containing protein [Bacillota bacterium]|nr:ASKHA domain-containing protein [Bacillota bacterium]